MVRHELIQKKLAKLEEYLEILEQSRPLSFDEFIGEPQRYASVERFRHLAIEALNYGKSHRC